MKFQLMAPWAGPRAIPYETGTVIDGASPEFAGVPMPIEAKALDVEAANALVQWHPHQQDRLLFASGISPTVKINT